MGLVTELESRKSVQTPTQQMVLAQLPELFTALSKQMTSVQKMMKYEIDLDEKALRLAKGQQDWTERVHDRLDALTMETRVTNMLLADLVATHKAILSEDTGAAADAIREAAYRRVLTGG